LYENKPRKAIIVCASEKTKQIVAKKKKNQRPKTQKPKSKKKDKRETVGLSCLLALCGGLLKTSAERGEI
jgi:hypothetical protein